MANSDSNAIEASTNCAPPTYGCARSDLITTDNLNPAPNMSAGKNTILTPSDFKLPIVRVTDGTLLGNKNLTVTPSGSNGDNVFNTNDTYFMVVDDDTWKYPVSFNPSTMKVNNTASWVIGKNQTKWNGSSSFSRVSPSVVYAVPGPLTPISGVNGNETTLYKLTLSGTTSISATGSKMFDFTTCNGMPSPYDKGYGVWHSVMTVTSGDQRYGLAFSNNKGGQNTGTDITVYDAPSGKCYRYDTAHAKLCTASGCVPMSLPDTYTIHEVYMSLNGEYMRIVFKTCTSGGCTQGAAWNPYIWQVGTTNVTRCYSPSHTAYCSGHMIEGYTHMYNAMTFPVMGKRALSDPLSYGVVNSTPDLKPITDTHLSNNAADPNDTYPFWVTNVQNVHTTFGGKGCNTSGNIYEGCTFPAPFYGEIFGITQNGGYIRAAHSYNSGSSSDFNCGSTIGSVSQTGKFFIWTSDWLTTLGKNDLGKYRCDSFIVNLAAVQGAVN